MTVREERTNWRDESLSKRHREWGFNCPATDIDFLLIEYNNGKVKAMVEYKHEGAIVDFKNSNGNGMNPKSYSALCDLADKAEIPFLIVIYSGDFQCWRVTPYNKYAKNILKEDKKMTEKEYITLLYRLRGINYLSSFF